MILQNIARSAGPYLGTSLHSLRVPPLTLAARRRLSTAPKEHTVDDVQALFAESLLLLADAEESRETTYFVEDFEDAKLGVAEALSAYEGLVARLERAEKKSFVEANGPKFRQLKEQFDVLEEALINDE